MKTKPKIEKGDASTGAMPRRVSPTVRRKKGNWFFPATCASERTPFTERTVRACECGERSAASRRNACIFSERDDFVGTLARSPPIGGGRVSADLSEDRKNQWEQEDPGKTREECLFRPKPAENPFLRLGRFDGRERGKQGKFGGLHVDKLVSLC